jgi:hypothetical protein
MNTTTTRTAADIQAQLRLLHAARALAAIQGLGSEARDVIDLLDAIHQHESALVGTVVTEIATLRAELGGPQYG